MVKFILAMMLTVVFLVACGDKPERGKGVPSTDASESNSATDADQETDTGQNSRIVDHLNNAQADQSSQWEFAKYATPGLIEATPQREGDSERGYKALLEESYVSCGLPERVFRRLLGDTPVVEAPERTDKADGLPFSVNVFTNELGVPTVSNNCLTCHGTYLFGELVVGLGNEFQDFTADASALVERAGFLVRGEEETKSWEQYADRVAAIAPYSRMHTLGVNPANNLTFALIAHRDAMTNEWSDTPLLKMPPTDPPPVSVPPWWRMSKKPAMFWLGEGRGDHARIMMAASMLCTDSLDALKAIDEYAPDIRAYIAGIDPPAWPFPLDESLAETGRGIFEQNCSSCHGTYGDMPTYPGRLVPIETVATDATLVDFALNRGAPYIDWFNRSFFGEVSMAAPGPGYVAPPLDGVWATGPFLHNGSVPSIRALLNSKLRPKVWRHREQNAADRENFNQSDIGWHYDALDAAVYMGQKPVEIYDTTLPGYSNSGHIFGDHLDEEQRRAVLEYIKTL